MTRLGWRLVIVNNSQDAFSQDVSNAQWEAYGNALAAGKSAEEAIAAGHAAAQAMRNERTLLNAADRSDLLRPHKVGVVRSILNVLRQDRGEEVGGGNG